MPDLSDASNSELVRELQRRQAMPMCSCRKWATYVGSYDADGYTLRCHGCLRSIGRCTCR